MYQINLVTYRTAINVRNAPRRVVNREKGILGGSFESVKLARTTLLKKVFRMEECQINKVQPNKNETYVIAALFGDNLIENVFTIVECSNL